MAVASGLLNQDQVKVAAVELVNMSTPNDGRHPQHLDHSLNGHERFPYMKTRSGAINTEQSPLARKRWTNIYLGSSVAFLLMSMITRRPGF
jgi:hypothetical protein